MRLLNKKSSLFVLIFVLLFSTFSYAIQNQVETEFYLTNKDGNITTTFNVGEDITFHYKTRSIPIKNKVEKKYWYKGDGGPFVAFGIYNKKEDLLGTTTDNRVFTAVITYVPINNSFTTSWFTTKHEKLDTGNYKAIVMPRVRSNKDYKQVLPMETINFIVINN
ncbi:hypothetical protein ACFL2K_01175 [Candidatus Margulisiibacteriota bacterium]